MLETNPVITADAAANPEHMFSAALAQSGRGRMAQSRAMVYSILAQALSSPGEALGSCVVEGALSALLGMALAEAPAEHQRMIQADLLDSFSVAKEENFSSSILAEYTRLFSANLQCLQYEADYLGHSAENSVHVIASIASIYSTFGVRLANTVAERPDHIAVELDFMSFLAAKEAYASDHDQIENAETCREAQIYFFSRHLSRWGTTFAANLAEATALPFYRSTCELLDRFLTAERAYLKVELSAPAIHEEKAPEKCGCSNCLGDAQTQPAELVQISSLLKEMMNRG